MASYELTFKKSVAKDLRELPKIDVRRILQRIRALADDPRPAGCEKLSGQERYRVMQGAFRIVYEIQDALLIVLVVKIAHRRDAYRN
jgi:mRNA interferase RelE/StbE